MPSPNKLALEGLMKLKGDLELYSAECLKIKGKTGGELLPFAWNRAQHHIHSCLEKQLKETGKVRALLLKGRQQGGSTLIAARFYHKTSMNPGMTAFIMAHEDKATANLFAMVKRYHENNPVRPSTRNSNAQELIFGALDGGYKLATAGSDNVGRSSTSQFFHGSEFGFWKNASEHLAGIGNTVADLPGTEVILESTANGLGNTFHQMWKKAEAGESEFIPIFVPWFWQPEYATPVRGELELSDDDLEYMQAYGLSMEQMQWRANKLATYDEDKQYLFDQEYPACPELAFQAPSGKPMISPALVSAAAKSDYMDKIGPIVIGCDPASDGESSDHTGIAWRRGRVVLRVERYLGRDEMQIAGLLAKYWREGDAKGRRPDGIFVDKGGIGSGIVSRLKELNIPVVGVMFGEGAIESDIYANRRAEMWYRMRDWLKDKPARIPDNPILRADISSAQAKDSSNGRKALESKPDIKKRLGRSPDLGDALALTFADHVDYRDDVMIPTITGHRVSSIAGY